MPALIRTFVYFFRAEALLALPLILAGILALAAPAPPEREIAVGTEDDLRWISDAWLPERSKATSFRWTNGDSVISQAGYATSATLLATLRMSAPLRDQGAGSPVTLLSDGYPAGTFAVAPEWRIYQVLTPPDGLTWNTSALSLQSPTAHAGADDRRPLGVALSEVSLRPVGGILLLPLTLRAVLLTGLVVLVRLWGGSLTTPLVGRLLGGMVALLLTLVLWLAPAIFDRALPLFWPLWAGGVGLLALWWLVPPHDGVGRLRFAARTLTIGLGLALTLFAISSLGWRIGNDLSNTHYIGMQMVEHGAVPARDFYEQNMPGTYLFHALIDLLFGATEQGLRIADLAILALILLLSAAFVRQIAPVAAWGSAIIFGLAYLAYGPPMSLQREFIMLLPISAALAIAPSRRHSPLLRAIVIGLCFGVASAIKPHAVIGAPLTVLALILAERQSATPAAKSPGTAIIFIIAALCGFALPPGAILIYLIANGALQPFVEIATIYWPLYGELSIVHRIIPPGERSSYLIQTFVGELRHQLSFLPALIGAGLAGWRARLGGERRIWAGLLWALAAAFTSYPLLAGKFWFYHWLPAVYCYALIAGLCLLPAKGAKERPPLMARLSQALPIALLIGTLLWHIQPPGEVGDTLSARKATSPRTERVDRIAALLRARLRPGDTVQSLDWTGGASQAMMLTDARSATSFVEDFYFYHHIDVPYIRMLRQRFLAQFDAARPRFVIQITGEYKPWASGPRTTRSFPELEERLSRDYATVLEGEGYRVLERSS